MGYLFLAILASFTISLLIKDNETRGADTELVLASNYISAAVLGWAFVLVHGDRAAGPWLAVSPTTLWLGLGGGVLWPAAFYIHMWGIRRYGVSLAGSASRLSLSIPVLFSFLILGERLPVVAAAGIVAAFAAFVLLIPAAESRREHGLRPVRPYTRGRALWFFAALLVVFGCVDLWANLHTTLAPWGERFALMAMIFTGGGTLTWLRLLCRRRRLALRWALRGLLIGVPNYFSTYLLLASLQAPGLQGRSAVVYAVYSAAGVVLAYLAGALLWREPLTGRNRLGVVAAVAAVVLLNLG